MSKKILVTGANGYLGKGVVKQLLDDGIEVIATDFKDNLIDKRADICCVDLFSLEDPYNYFDQPDAVLHMAWRDGFVHSSPNHINDLPNHYSFLTKMIDAGVKQVAVMGSMHEIGFFEGSIKEDTPANPQSLYGISKNALRNAIRLACDKKCVYQWLRGYYIVGNMEPHENIGHCRLDRMTDVTRLDEPVKDRHRIEELKTTTLSEYFTQHFYMFSGRIISIRLRTEERMMDALVDWFGKEFKILKRENGEMEVLVRCNEMAMKYWALQYGEYVEVLAPNSLRESVAKIVKEMYEVYCREQDEQQKQ